MAHTCSECCYLKIDGDTNNGQYWCEYKNEWKYAYIEECWHYCTAYSRNSKSIKDAYEFSENSQKRSGCFITTALCNILSMPDNNCYLTSLRKFRKENLQKNSEGLKILVQYDVIGPKIAEKLYQDSGKFNFAYILFENYIKPIVDLLNENEYKEATEKYIEMTTKLIKFYHIDDTIDINIEDIDATKAGHGKVYLKNCKI